MDSTSWGIKLRVTGTFVVQDIKSLEDLNLGTINTNALLAGAELLIPLRRYWTLRPRFDAGIGTDLGNDETVFLIEAAVLGEFIFPWRRFYLSLEPALRVNGKSGNELGSKDDDIHGLLHAEARYPLPFTIAQNGLFAGVYAETGYFFNSLELVSVEGTPREAQAAFEVGVTTGFYDIRPKIWFLRLPRVSVGYRFSGNVRGVRIRIGGDWATPVMMPK